MRSYGQYCGLARALDVVGDRWTLLIVRELLLTGSARYTDLLQGLPGIATNLLADRLRDLEEAGLVVREDAPPPVATALFRLTPRGKELEGVIAAFGRWAAPLMGEVRPGDAVRPLWYLLPIRLYLRDASPGKPPVAIQLILDDTPLIVETAGDGTLRASAGTSVAPAATLAGSPTVVMGLLGRRLTLAQARRRGLRFRGDAAVLRRIGRAAAPAAGA